MSTLFPSEVDPKECDHSFAWYDYGKDFEENAKPEGSVQACVTCGQLAKGQRKPDPRTARWHLLRDRP